MTDRDDAEMERLQQTLQEARRAPLPSATADAQRQRVQVQYLAKLIREVPASHSRWRRRRRISFSAIGMAAAAILTFGSWHLANQSATPPLAVAPQPAEVLSLRQVVGKVIATRSDGSDVMVHPNMRIADGDRVSTTAEAFASLEFDSGTLVDVSSATTLQVVERKELSLRVGRVDINVPKRPVDPDGPDSDARALAVKTPNATVVVQGTIFSVEVLPQRPEGVTEVSVTRGSVMVHAAGERYVVAAGERWRSDLPHAKGKLADTVYAPQMVAPEAVAMPTEENAETRDVPRRASSKPHAGPKKGSAAAPSSSPEAKNPSGPSAETDASSLREQNRLFDRGLQARDREDFRRAEYWFSQLLKRYPDSPLTEAASRERDTARARLAN